MLDRAKAAQWPSAAVAGYQRILSATGQAVPTGAARAALPCQTTRMEWQPAGHCYRMGTLLAHRLGYGREVSKQ